MVGGEAGLEEVDDCEDCREAGLSLSCLICLKLLDRERMSSPNSSMTLAEQQVKSLLVRGWRSTEAEKGWSLRRLSGEVREEQNALSPVTDAGSLGG